MSNDGEKSAGKRLQELWDREEVVLRDENVTTMTGQKRTSNAKRRLSTEGYCLSLVNRFSWEINRMGPFV